MFRGQTCQALFIPSNTVIMKTETKTTGLAGGKVTGPGINCGLNGYDCSEYYYVGNTIVLTAQPASNSKFDGWEGRTLSGFGSLPSCNGQTSSSVSVKMNGDYVCVAKFSVPTYTLTVSKAGTGRGSVISGDGKINCGTTCTTQTASYNPPTTVTLTPQADINSVFTGWTGGPCLEGSTLSYCTVTMDNSKSVTANFASTASTTNKRLTVILNSQNCTGGSVSSQPAGISCSPTCSALFTTNSLVQLTAKANTGCKFSGWALSCGGSGTTNPITIKMDSDKTCQASFSPI